MNRDDIIRMAREVGLERIYSACDEPDVRYAYEDWDDEIERFAALVYAEGHKDGLDDFEAGVLPAAIKAEREACAKVLDEMAEKDKLSNYYQVAAIAIRARGQQ